MARKKDKNAQKDKKAAKDKQAETAKKAKSAQGTPAKADASVAESASPKPKKG